MNSVDTLNYSKPYGHGQQLINGLQFSSRLKKSFLPCLKEIWGLEPTLTYFFTEIAALYVDISQLACRNEGPPVQARAWIRLISIHKTLLLLPFASLMD